MKNLKSPDYVLRMSNLDPKEKDDDSESTGSDESEDMIEVDEDEFERRRADCLSDMKELETLFNKLKETLIAEKQILVEQKLKEIDDETAEEYTVPLQKLKQNMEIKIKLACLLRDYKNKNIDHIYQYEEMSIKQSLEEDKTAIYDKHVSKLEDEIKKLEESRRLFMLDYNWYQLAANGATLDDLDHTQHEFLSINPKKQEQNAASSNPIDEDLEELRKLTSGLNKSANKSKTASSPSGNSSLSPVLLHGTPYIVYSLQDYEILEDLFAISSKTNKQCINQTSIHAK